MDFRWCMMPFHPPRRSCADAYDRDTAFLVQADQLGSHEAWMGEPSTETWDNAPVPELRIAKALALTERLIVATGVTMLPLHHPVDTAHRIAMLDHRARGRFSWGIGVRSLQTDLHLYGVDSHAMDDVRERGKEALEVKPAAMAGVAGFPFVGGPLWSVVGRGDGKRCRRLRCGTTHQEDDNASSF